MDSKTQSDMEEKVPKIIHKGSKYEFIRKDLIVKAVEKMKEKNGTESPDASQHEYDVACGYDMACDDVISYLSKFVELSAEVDKHPKNILVPSKECEPGLREPLEEEND